jgi:hypothetical protein
MINELESVPLKTIHIDVLVGSVIFEGVDGRAISWNPRLMLEHLQSTAPPSLQEAEAESDPLVKLTGKLKSVPKEGRPDSSGFPTAWARFAAHAEGSKQAHMYIATFHRKAREIALGLKTESQILVEGYPHQATQSDRLDTLSVVHIINYPDKSDNSKDAN